MLDQQYAADYEKCLKPELGSEQKILQDESFSTMLATKNLADFEAFIKKKSKQRGAVRISMDSPSSPGFATFHKRLMDPHQGCFNGGKLFLCDWKPLEELLISKGREHMWK